jgi:hypothetical protein
MYIIERLIDFLNSNLFSATVSSALGAVGGAQAIKMIETANKRYKDISIINADLVLMSNTLGKLISLKKAVEPIHQATIALKNNPPENENSITQQALVTIIGPKILPFERVLGFVYAHATIHYMSVTMCTKAMESIDEVTHVLNERNQTLSAEIYHDNLKMLGKLYDLTEALNLKIDCSLFYTYYAFKEFRNLALRIMPKKLHKNILDLDIDKHDKKLIPPHNFIKGYYDK